MLCAIGSTETNDAGMVTLPLSIATDVTATLTNTEPQ